MDTYVQRTNAAKLRGFPKKFYYYFFGYLFYTSHKPDIGTENNIKLTLCMGYT